MTLPIRKSPRWKDYDYRSEGCYFVTIVTKNREQYFGKVIDGKMVLNEFGKQTYCCRNQIPIFHPYVEIDEFICMPNHIHGILHIVGMDHIRPKNYDLNHGNDQHDLDACNNQWISDACNASLQCKLGSLGSIIRGFKIGVTKFANHNNIPFARQSRYHDHVIRNTIEYEKIKHYIQTNPQNWDEDKFKKLLQDKQIEASDCFYFDHKLENLEAAATNGIEGVLYVNNEQMIPILQQNFSSY